MSFDSLSIKSWGRCMLWLLKFVWNLAGTRTVSIVCIFFFSSRRRHTRFDCDWSSDVCSSDLPVKFAALLIEMQLLRREGFPFANDGYPILTIEIGAFDRAVVATRNSHVGPVNVSRLNINNYAVPNSTPGYNDFQARAVGISRMNSPATR